MAPTAGVYRYTATFNVLDDSPSGVGINFIRAQPGGGSPYIVTPMSVINGMMTSYTWSGMVTLGASDSFGFAIDNQGNFSNDSTGVDFALRAGIPEPATWAMLIMGFGFVGGAMRYRMRSTKVAVATA